jgi:hypothetical protein
LIHGMLFLVIRAAEPPLGGTALRQLFELKPEDAADQAPGELPQRGSRDTTVSAAPVTGRTVIRPVTSGVSILQEEEENIEKLARLQYTRDTLCRVPVPSRWNATET